MRDFSNEVEDLKKARALLTGGATCKAPIVQFTIRVLNAVLEDVEERNKGKRREARKAGHCGWCVVRFKDGCHCGCDLCVEANSACSPQEPAGTAGEVPAS